MKEEIFSTRKVAPSPKTYPSHWVTSIFPRGQNLILST